MKPKKKKRQRKTTEYKPTVAQKRLLEVLLNPEHRLKSITEICCLAKVNRTVYYDAFDKEGFLYYYTRQSKALIRKAHSAIINASIRQALRGDSAHTKLLLTMTGDYADRQIFPDKDGKPQPVAGGTTIVLSPMEAAARIAFLFQIAIENKKKAELIENKNDQ